MTVLVPFKIIFSSANLEVKFGYAQFFVSVASHRKPLCDFYLVSIAGKQHKLLSLIAYFLVKIIGFRSSDNEVVLNSAEYAIIEQTFGSLVTN